MRRRGAGRGRRRPEHLCLSRCAGRQHGRLRARVRCAHQIKLEQNYRSYSNILDSANALISHNNKRLGKNLRTDQGPGEPVRVYEATSDFAEAQWMVDEMRQLVRRRPAFRARKSPCSTAATRKAA
jgi:superfamily I DNA/RNA helicase